jgi:hypothetical protein
MMLDPRHIQSRLGQLKSARTTHDSHWQEVADYMIPARAFTVQHAAGSKRSRNLIFNGHPVLALEQLAGGLHGMLTSPALRWFALRPMPAMAQDRGVRAWFDAATDVMYAYFQSPTSGLNVALHEGYLDIAGFGSAVLFTPDKGRRGPMHQAIPLAECWYAENADRVVDTLYRAYDLPLREVLRLWPETAPDRLRRQANERPDQPVPIVHATEPHRSAGSGAGARGATNAGWDTCWCTGGDWLEHGRYREFPFAVPRWTKRSGEVYGTGPGMAALPDVKLLNKLEELNLRGLAKVVDPPMLLPDDGFLNAPNMNPGAFNYMRTDSRWSDRIGPLQTGARPDLAEQKIEQVQERISGSFYTTWLRLPQQPNMTATEVLQRRDELLRLLGPMVARLEAELLSPLIERSFAILLRNGLFPPPPPQLANAGWTVEYQGPLSRAQRLADAETVMRWFAAMQPLVQADPTILDAIDTDAAAQYLGDRHGAPATLMRSPQDIARRREGRANQQQQIAQAEALASGAGAAKDGAAALATLAGIQGGGGAA